MNRLDVLNLKIWLGGKKLRKGFGRLLVAQVKS
jgi:hypothetical protein